MPETQNKDDVVVEYFLQLLNKNEDLSSGIAAIKTLLMILESSKFQTIHILQKTMLDAVEAMKNRSHLSIAAIASGGELFCRFITLSIGDKSIEECQRIMLERGNVFLKKLLDSRKCITKLAEKFLKDGCKVLTHSRSRVVLQTMIHAAENNKHFHVYVTEGGRSDDRTGKKMCEELEKAGIECTLILDSAVGYVMESVDFVMVGAEAVVESGGIINRIGSFTTAICAKDMKKPFYVLSESFKFTRLYPLNQRDLSDEYKYPGKCSEKDVSKMHPSVDYTPPAYITLLFTDLGILTPSAVSDELIKLYM